MDLLLGSAVGADARVREAVGSGPENGCFFSSAPVLERHRMRHHLFELTQEAGGWSDIHTAGKGKGHAGESPVRTSVIPETEKPGAGL